MKMKCLFCLFLILFSVELFAQTDLPKHKWAATLKIVDESGAIVPEAEVIVYYGQSHSISGPSDQNGNFAATHLDAVENLEFEASQTGYYPYREEYHMGRNYQPEKWNIGRTIVLKKIIHPIPMFAKTVNLGIPASDKPVGFDLEAGDWVSPYGHGVQADFIFAGHRERRSKDDTDYKLSVTFPNAGDGIQEFSVPAYYLDTHGSALKSNEQAPTNGYQPEWIQTKTRRPGKPLVTNWKLNRNYYFRIRTKLDEHGNVISCNYGKIYGDFMYFTYYLNPTPDDPDVEFDVQHDLLRGLTYMQEPIDP